MAIRNFDPFWWSFSYLCMIWIYFWAHYLIERFIYSQVLIYTVHLCIFDHTNAGKCGADLWCLFFSSIVSPIMPHDIYVFYTVLEISSTGNNHKIHLRGWGVFISQIPSNDNTGFIQSNHTILTHLLLVIFSVYYNVKGFEDSRDSRANLGE